MEIEALSPFGKIVWEDRYALKDENGKLIEKDIFETFRRVSTAIASKEKDPKYWGNKFYQIMADQLFCPAGRVLAHAGTHYSQLLNCFVLPFKADSLEEIMNTTKDMAIVQKFGGGCIGGESNVLTNKGPIPLKEIVEGNDSDLKVLSFDPDSHEMEYCDILERHTNKLSGDRVFEIEFDNTKGGIAARMRASDWHPFFVFDGREIVQVRADELKPGMVVIGPTDQKEVHIFEPVSVFDPSWTTGIIKMSPIWQERLQEKGEAVRGKFRELSEDQYIEASRETAASILRKCGEEKVANAVLSSQIVRSSKATGVPETLYDLTIAKNQTYIASDPSISAYVVVHNTGFNFSRLRPSGSYIKGVNGRSSGIIGFIGMMSTVSEVIEQGGCFVSDTLVATLGGPKKIKELRKGDYVYSMSDRGFIISRCACDAFLTKRHAEVWRVRTNNNLNIYCTKDHPFMPQNGFDFKEKNYIQAKDLKKDISLMSFSRSAMKGVDNGEKYAVSTDQIYASYVGYSCQKDVWNVEIEDTHNFVVCDFNMRTGVVVSNTRRGANIGLLEVWHPDIWEFISYKTEHNWECLREFIDVNDFDKWESFKYENLYKWQMFNVSVGITDEFLKAVGGHEEWPFKWGEEEWLLYTVIFKKFLGEDDYKEFEFEVIADCDKTAIWKTRRKVPYPTGSDIFEVVSKRRVKALEIWDRICYNAWADGCPGIINLSTARKMHNLEYCSPIEATNPCLHGDTLVAVADGRNAVSIRQLAEEGEDVPVYCRDDHGKVVIRMMRHPRITGYNKKILKVTIEGGHELRVTENHRFVLSNGTVKEAKDLKSGDGFFIMNKLRAPFEAVLKHNNSKSKDYYWINSTDKKSWNLDHRLIYNFHFPGELEGKVTHHKDGNGLNNNIDNLESFVKSDHDKLHGIDMLGDNNPMRRAETEWSKEKWQEYRGNMSRSVSGEKNGRYSGISNSKLFEIAVNLTREYGRKVSSSEWKKFALKNNYPSQFSGFRTEVFGTVAEFLEKAAIEADVQGVGLKHIFLTNFKRYVELKEKSDLDIFFDKGIRVRKECEACGKEFVVLFNRREQAFCSRICCYNNQNNMTEEIKKKIRKSKEIIRGNKRVQQINVYNDLKFELGRDPMKKEWVLVCKKKGIPFRLPTKKEIAEKGHIGTFCGYGELKKVASLHNHRVVKIEEDSYGTVYTGTVDNFHNFFIGHFEGSYQGHPNFIYINNLQCGEQLLGPNSSCNLSSILLPNFVVKETKSIDWDKLDNVVRTAVRFADNVLDNSSFPISEIGEIAHKERRVGIGTMGVHDMLIKMELDYDSDQGREAVGEVLEFIRNGAYKASIELAEEKGSFPLFKKRKFLGGSFIQTLPEEIRGLIDKKGMRNSTLLSQAPTGCLVGNSLIPTEKGLFKIGDISDVEEKEWVRCEGKVFCVRNDMKKTGITHFFNNGKTKTLKIVTSKGYSIEGTLDHKIRVISKGHGYSWKRLEEIEIDDKIVLKKNFFIDKATWLKPEVAKILGYYMANGWWSSSPVKKGSDTLGYRIYFSLDPKNIQLQNEIKELILDAWGVTFKICEKRIRERTNNGFKFEISNVKLYKWFEKFNCIKNGAVNAFIPDIILRSSKECVIEFIKGYWMGDGCFQNKKSNVSFKTVSARMAIELQVVLLSIGIPSSIYYDDSAVDKEVFIEDRKIKNIRPSYTISVDRGYTEDLLNYFKIKAPFDFVQRTEEVVPVFIDELSNYNLPINSEIDKEDTFVSIRAYKKIVPKEKWNWFVVNDLMIVFAKEIVRSEKESCTFDLTVADRTHTYIANGFVTHNSISALNNLSSGCEPWFSLSFQRNTRLGSYEDGCKTYIEWRKENPGKPKPSYFKVAQEIAPEDHVKMLILFTRYICSSVSKCVAKGTMIVTSNGIVPIESMSDFKYSDSDTFSGTNKNYLVIDENGALKKVLRHYYGGKKSCFTVRFNNGFKLTAAKTHLLKTVEGWKSLNDLKKGDIVLYRVKEMALNKSGYVPIKQKPDFRNHIKRDFPSYFTEDFAEFIGAWLADGSCNCNSISICKKDDIVIKRLVDLFRILFGVEVEPCTDKRNGVKSLVVNSRAFVKYFKVNYGSNAQNKRVPMEIMISSHKVQKAFLKGISMDGYIKGRDGTLVVYDGYSKQIAESISYMLSSLGVRYYLGKRKVKGGKLSNQSYNVVAYLLEKGIIDPIESHKKLYSTDSSGRLQVYVPDEVKNNYEELPPAKSENYYSFRNLRDRLKKKSSVRESLLKKLNVPVDYNLSCVEITDIEEVGVREVYDIEVEDTHSYLINGIVSHNTVNLPNSATVQTVKDTFLYAMENGVKGITIFRDGSKEGVLVDKTKKKDSKTWENVNKAKQVVEKIKGSTVPFVEEKDSYENVTAPKKRGDKTVGSTYRIHMQSHNLYVTVNRNKDGELVEIFTTVGESKNPNAHHTSGVEDSWAEGLGKIISLALRAGVKPISIIRNLKNIPSDKPVFTTIGDKESSEHVPSPPHAIARVIEEELLEELLEKGELFVLEGGRCKECSSTNTERKSSTCYECKDCGYSGCS